MYKTFSGCSNKWGELFGIDSKELPISILNQIKFEKLCELIDFDSRARTLVCLRMMSEKPSQIAYLKNIPNLHDYPVIVDKYNQYLEQNYYNNKENRRNYQIIFWEFLNDENKIKEVELWACGQPSILKEDNIDYDWVRKIKPELVDQIIEKNLKTIHHWEYRQYALNHMITTIGEDKIEYVMEKIFNKDSPNRLKIHALTNKNLPEKYTISALRLLATKKYGSAVSVIINKEILEKLPTITRLKVIEKLLYNKTNMDISEEDLRSLLFGSVIRYPQRVEAVIKKFNFIFKT